MAGTAEGCDVRPQSREGRNGRRLMAGTAKGCHVRPQTREGRDGRRLSPPFARRVEVRLARPLDHCSSAAVPVVEPLQVAALVLGNGPEGGHPVERCRDLLAPRAAVLVLSDVPNDEEREETEEQAGDTY